MQKDLLRVFTVVFLIFMMPFQAYSSGWHPADQVVSGQFTQEYNFTGNTNFYSPVGFGLDATGTQEIHITGGSGDTQLLLTNNGAGNSDDSDGFQLEFLSDGTTQLRQRENADIRFFTNGQRVFTISNTGNVAVGSGSPSAKLDVNGTVLADNIIVSAQTSCTYMYTDVSGNVLCGNGTIAGGGGPWNSSGNDVYLFNSSTALVGIGTTDPDEQLHVEGEVLIDLYNLGNGSGLYFREGFTNYNLGFSVFNDGDGSADGLDINAYDGVYFTTGSNDRAPVMIITGAGDVDFENNALLDIDWSTSDDGAGSGLDADTVDGITSANLARTDIREEFDTGLYVSASTPGDVNSNNFLAIDRSGTTVEAFVSWYTTGTNQWLLGTDNTGDEDFVLWDAGTGLVFEIKDGGAFELFRDLDMSNNALLDIDWSTSDDGAGSSLDADLLDGITSASFVRGDRVDGGTTQIRADDADFIISDDTDTTTNFFWRDHDINTLYIGTANAVPTLRANLDANNNAITNINWASSDDGSGSSLDADLLDGQEGSYYQRRVASTCAAGSSIRVIAADGSVTCETDDDSGVDNYVNESGDTMTGNLAMGSNRFTFTDGWELYRSASNRMILTQSGSGGAEFQLDGDGATYTNAVLSVGGGTVWTSANDGASSGLDADTLDGLTSTNFMRNYGMLDNADQYINARVIRNSNSASNNDGMYIGFGNFNSGATRIYGGGSTTAYSYMDSGGVWRHDDNSIYWHAGNDGSGSGLDADTIDGAAAVTNPATATLNMNNNAITNINWASSDDGAGSSLDADLLDGLSSASFLRTSGDTIYNSATAANSFYVARNSNVNEAMNFRTDDGRGYIEIRQDEVNSRLRFEATHSSTSTPNTAYLEFANLNGAVSLSVNGNTAWHAGNDGAGSGLDADLLDGLSSNSYIQQAGTVTSSLTWIDNVWASFGSSSDFNMAWNGGSNYFYMRGYNHGAPVYFQGEDASGTNRNMMYYDPDSSVLLYYQGTEAFRTIDGGIQTEGAVQYIFDDSDNDHFYLRGTTHGTDMWIQAEDNGGTLHSIFSGDPDDHAYMFYDGAWKFRTLTNGVEAQAYYYTSDERLKTNFSDYEQGLSEVLQLDPQYYYWKNETMGEGKQIGLVAQEVQKIAPELVSQAVDDGFLSLDYGSLTPLLINAIQDQQEIIDTQGEKLEDQQEQIDDLKVLVCLDHPDAEICQE